MNYRPTILVVDGSEAFAMYISLLLQRLGFHVVPSKNGAEALVLLKIMKPDIVIVDAAIQETDGVTAATLISSIEHTSKAPVIILYSEKDIKAFEACAERQHFGSLVKPINIIAFHNLITQCIASLGTPRRKFLRAFLNQEVSVQHMGSTYKHFAASLSEGGIYIRSIDTLSVGSEVIVSLKLKSNKPVEFNGSVIYKKDVYTDVFKMISGVAIEFKDLNKNQLKMLRNYIIYLLVGDIVAERDGIFIIDNKEEKPENAS